MKKLASWLKILIPLALILRSFFQSWRGFVNGVENDWYTKTVRRLWDFYVYYVAGHDVITAPHRLYDAEPIVFGFVNLPIVAYFFVPFARLDIDVADFLFFGLSILSVVLIGYLLIKIGNLSGWSCSIFIAILALNHPLFYSIRLGNTSHLVLLVLIATLICYQKRLDILAGLLLMLAVLIKPPFILLLVYFLWNRRFKLAIAFLSSTLAMVAASIVLLGVNVNWIWLSKCVINFSGRAVFASNVQSVTAFLLRLSIDSGYQNWPISWVPITVEPQLKLVSWLTILSLIAVTFWQCRNTKATNSNLQALDFSIFVSLIVITYPLSWTHYYLFLLLPISIVLSSSGTATLRNKLWLGIFAIATILIDTITFDAFFPKNNLFASSTLLGGVLLWIILLIVRNDLYRSIRTPKNAETLTNA